MLFRMLGGLEETEFSGQNAWKESLPRNLSICG